MKMKIAPSLMCVDFFNLDEIIRKFEKHNIDLLHVDVMDGSFVPNYALGTDIVSALKNRTKIPVDIHLMIESPEHKLDWFEFGENDYVSVHYEATNHLQRVLTMIKSRGAKAVVAINPATPLCVLENVLDYTDAVLIMTVNPGYSGQKLVESTLKKIEKLREYLDENGYENIEIEVDGNVSFENAVRMKNAGANIFVAGTASIFNKAGTISENINKLKENINL